MTNLSQMNVGLSQINNSFSNQNYLPLSVGMLQAYAQKHLPQADKYNFQLPLYRRMPVEEAVNNLKNTDVAFFSTYVWNYRISLEIARRLRQESPDTLVVFGGPHVPDRIEGFLETNSFIDIACHGEGEQSATAILGNLQTRNWTNVPGISYLEKGKKLVTNPKAPRLKELTDTPSPYLEGVFEQLIATHPEETWIALWETNRGCPFSCTFCDWGSATQSKVHTFDQDRLQSEVDWFAANKIEFIFCCDANFGILPRDIELASYVAEVKKKTGYPNALSVQNTKNATERAYQVQKILSDAGLNKGVDIALQSVDAQTLESIKRGNISTDTYQELQKRFTNAGVETYTDVILGLPGETYDSFANGISLIMENGQHNRIQFNNLSILPNAEMGDPAYQKKFGMKIVETKTINIHGSVNEKDGEIFETQMMVVGTKAMPKKDWVNTRVFSWMAALLHFDKTLQIPFILIHQSFGIPYRELIEEFTLGDLDSFPTLEAVRDFFVEQATSLQNGGAEYVQSTDWLNIWWPADEYTLIKLSQDNQLEQFYGEAESLLGRLLAQRSVTPPSGMLHDAVNLNHNLIKQPFQTKDLDLVLGYNIWETYRSTVFGDDVQLEAGEHIYHLDRTSTTWSSWDEWCREVIWYGNKKGAYLYGNDAIESQLSGHF